MEPRLEIGIEQRHEDYGVDCWRGDRWSEQGGLTPTLRIKSLIDLHVRARTENGMTVEGGFGRVLDAFLGLRLRSAETRRKIAACSRSFGRWRWAGHDQWTGSGEWSDSYRLQDYRTCLATELATVAIRPLTPRLLLEVLPITNKERLRWTKDNRLPRSGAVMIRRGQLISVPTYSVAAIEKIIATPGLIENWRATDGNSP